MPKWTEQQRDAIADRGHSLIVCAAAGSGKTAVLVERIVQLVREGCPIENMLVVTFTNAAAGEMRQRIGEALGKAAREDPALGEQVMALSRASISTLHRFCGNLLREHFQALSIDPGFRIGDEQECGVLSHQAMEDAIYSCYEVGSDAFLAADRCYTQEELSELAFALHRFMMTRPDPWAFLARAQETVRLTGEAFEQSPAARLLADFAGRRLERLCANARETLALCEGENGPLHYAAACGMDVQLTADLAAAAADGYAALHDALHGVTFAALGRKKKTDLFDEDIADRVKARRDALKKAVADVQTAFALTLEDAAADIRMTAAPLDGLAELAKTYDALYTAAKRQRGMMDFNDLEHNALAALALPEVRASLRAQYRYVFIDEYQDSSAIQEAIVGSFAREDGLFLVGDVKQSIYRFRLADPTIFLRKYNAYVPAGQAEDGQPRKVLLSKNFRSRQSVLDGCNAIFRSIMSRRMGEMDYGAEEQLYFGAAYYPPHPDTAAEYHFIDVADTEEERFDRAAVEARFVAERIRRMLDEGYAVSGGDGLRRCTPEDFVILMRSPRSRLKAFTAALAARNIPCAADESSDFFATVEIAVVWSLLQIIDNPRQDVPLISVLRSPLFGFTPDRLAAIRALQKDGDYYDALLLDDSADTQDFLRTLESLRAAARDETVDVLLWRIYNTCRCEAVFGAMPGGQARKDNLTAFYTYARQMAGAGKKSLFDFTAHLRTLLENGDAPDLSTRQSAGGVRIMSIHKSKGLEFPIVFLCDLSKRFDPRDVQEPVLVHPQLGLGVECVDRARSIRYDTVSKTAVALQLQRESKSEEMRILYVAMTRAQEKMIAVDCRKKGRKRVADLAGLAGVPTPPEAVAAGKCLGDWVLLPLLCTAPGAKLCQWADVPTPEQTTEDGGWQVYLWDSPAAMIAAVPQEDAAVPLPEEQPFDPAPLEWVYGHGAATVTPGKVTATQLKGRAIDEEIADGAPTRRRAVLFEKPLFLRETTGLTAAEKGTAVHAVMQYIDFRTPATPSAVAAEVEKLAQRRLLTPQQAAAVDCAMVARFLASPLAERLRGADKVWREYRFSLLTDAALYDPQAAGEELLLQGVVDCTFETPSGLVVVDFKTDRVTPQQQSQRAEGYRPQLEAYALALGKVLEKDVSEKLLYFFHTNSTVKL